MSGENEGGPADESAGVDPEAAEESEESAGFTNRAARRAKGKGTAQAHPQTFEKGQHPGGRGAVQGPRQWGNRRSG